MGPMMLYECDKIFELESIEDNYLSDESLHTHEIGNEKVMMNVLLARYLNQTTKMARSMVDIYNNSCGPATQF